ncbi:TPA: hypothetical protein ACNVDX_003665 [Citrobacter gillenii]
MTNNKLPEWRKALNKAVENYQSAQAWYEENQDSPSAEQDVDAAAGEIEKLIGQHGVLIVLNLLDEIDELQERRKADSTVFMYGIVTPDGDAYMEDFCVSNDLGLMEDEASALNDSFDTDGYRAVALYTASPAPTAPLVPEPATVETTYPDVQTNWQDAKMYAEGWNACRTAMLATAQ